MVRYLELNFINLEFLLHIINNYKIGLKALETKQLRYFHIKTIIMVLKKLFKKEVKFKFNVAFNYPVTKKPEQARMGKGKGKRHHWVALVRKGTILLEICGTSKITNFNLMNSLLAISYKLPIKCMFVKLMY